MFVQQNDSGLLVATDKKPEPPKPPRHPVCDTILSALLQLRIALADYEQTTHGGIGPNRIEDVAKALVDAYSKPTAYTISELDNKIRCLEKSP